MRTRVEACRRGRRVLASWTSATSSASCAEVRELVGDVAVVHVDRDGAQLVAREHRLEVLDAGCGGSRPTWSPGPTPRSRERVRDPGRALVELARRCAASSPQTTASRSGTWSATHSNRSARLNSIRDAPALDADVTLQSFGMRHERRARPGRRLRARRRATSPPEFARARARTALGPGLADRVPRRGARRRRATSSSTRSATSRSSSCAATTARSTAFHNACLHRGTRLADGARLLRRRRSACRVPRVALRARRPAHRGRRRARVHRLPEVSRSRTVRVECWGGFVFVNLGPRRRAAARLPRPAPDAARAVPPRETALPRVPAARSSRRTGRRSSTRSTRATTCRARTRRSCRGPTT